MSQTQTPTNATPMIALVEGYLHDLAGIVKTGKAGSLTCTITGTYPDHSWKGDTVRVTPAKAKAALNRYLAAARKEMPNQARDMCSGFAPLLKVTYGVKGKNPRTVKLFAHAVNRVRGTAKRAAKAEARTAALAQAEADGGHWFAQGVQTPYPTETQARKAWARTHVGPKWWEGDKSSILSGATVRRGTAYAATKATKAKAAPAKVQSSPSVTVTVAQLRETCKALKLPSTGTKATLVERISKHALGL